MSGTITLVCTLSPRPGKFDRVKALMVNLCQNVKANEKGCRRYAVWEEEDTNGDPDIVLIEEWGSKADLEKHHETAYLKETHERLEEEDLLTKPEVIKSVSHVESFGER